MPASLQNTSSRSRIELVLYYYLLLNAVPLASSFYLGDASRKIIHNQLADSSHTLQPQRGNKFRSRQHQQQQQQNIIARCESSLTKRALINSSNGEDFNTIKKADLNYAKRSQRWILLIDDETAIRQAVGQMLSDRGYQVTTCPDGNVALKMVLNRERGPATATTNSDIRDTDAAADAVVVNRSVPDVIVSDVRMPVMDGLELLRAIRSDEKLAHVPVVLLTAKGLTEDRIAGYQAGADAYLPKPFDPEELVTVIDNVIDRHEQLNDSNNLALSDLQQDLLDIKYLLMETGGGGVGSGWKASTPGVFLAPDERQILNLLAEGFVTKEIAQRTFLSTRRVEQLLTSMYRKTNVKNRTELVRWAVSTGTVKL